jgi:hypothetical protein
MGLKVYSIVPKTPFDPKSPERHHLYVDLKFSTQLIFSDEEFAALFKIGKDFLNKWERNKTRVKDFNDLTMKVFGKDDLNFVDLKCYILTTVCGQLLVGNKTVEYDTFLDVYSKNNPEYSKFLQIKQDCEEMLLRDWVSPEDAAMFKKLDRQYKSMVHSISGS